MTTRNEIIQLADKFIREKGYNAFSFYDISKEVGIKTASIHYHFPFKSNLGVAVIEQHMKELQHLIEKYKDKSPIEKLDKFLLIYTQIKQENKVCLVGSLSTDLNTVDEDIKVKLKTFASMMLDWVSSFLEAGRKSKVFWFEGLPRVKAMMIICNMLAIVQLSRLTSDKDFKTVRDTIKQDLLKK